MARLIGVVTPGRSSSAIDRSRAGRDRAAGRMVALAYIGRQLAELYRRGFALFWLAPVTVALVVVPEFVQHVAEIKLGMFVDVEHARAFANDPLRWRFGYAKLIGLGLAMIAAARFWAIRDGRSWWRLGDVAWLRFAAALLLFVGISALPDFARAWLPEWLYWTAYVGLSIATLPLLFPALAALFGERKVALSESYRRGWRWLPLLLMLLVAAYLPAFAAHAGLHRLAMGQPVAIVWASMTVDSLVVGLLASLVGAAFALGYRAGFPARER